MQHLVFLLLLATGCATTRTPSTPIAYTQIPPRLVPPSDNYDSNFNLEPLPFTKHSLAELDADRAAIERANPEREALEGIADFQINEFLKGWEHP